MIFHSNIIFFIIKITGYKTILVIKLQKNIFLFLQISNK